MVSIKCVPSIGTFISIPSYKLPVATEIGGRCIPEALVRSKDPERIFLSAFPTCAGSPVEQKPISAELMETIARICVVMNRDFQVKWLLPKMQWWMYAQLFLFCLQDKVD